MITYPVGFMGGGQVPPVFDVDWAVVSAPFTPLATASLNRIINITYGGDKYWVCGQGPKLASTEDFISWDIILDGTAEDPDNRIDALAYNGSSIEYVTGLSTGTHPSGYIREYYEAFYVDGSLYAVGLDQTLSPNFDFIFFVERDGTTILSSFVTNGTNFAFNAVPFAYNGVDTILAPAEETSLFYSGNGGTSWSHVAQVLGTRPDNGGWPIWDGTQFLGINTSGSVAGGGQVFSSANGFSGWATEHVFDDATYWILEMFFGNGKYLFYDFWDAPRILVADNVAGPYTDIGWVAEAQWSFDYPQAKTLNNRIFTWRTRSVGGTSQGFKIASAAIP